MNSCCEHLFREAKREIEIRDKRITENQTRIENLIKKNEKLEVENAKLLGVVKFYAENKNWRDIVAEEAYGNNCGLERGCFDSIVYEDCQDDIGGKRARQALKELEEK